MQTVRRLVIGALAVTLLAPFLGAAAASSDEPPDGLQAATSAAVPSVGCGTSTAAAGETTVTIASGGVDRTYIRYVPSGHDGTTPIPLVVAVHGLGEGSSLHRQMTEYIPLAEAEGFAVAFPQGLGSPAAWNVGLTSNDTVLMGAILDELEAALCLDTNRIHMSGFSMGAFMTSTVACVYADRVASVAPVAGLRNPTGCAPARPIPLISFHGTVDTFVAFGPTPANATAWADRNGCGSPPTETFVANDAENPDVDIWRIEYPCDGPGAAAVEYYRIDNGGHGWPGSAFSRAIAAAVGYTTFEIDATELIWEFFQANPMPDTGTISGTVTDTALTGVEGVTVAAYGPDDVWVGSHAATTDADGTYRIDGVEPDEYQVYVIPPAGSALDRQWHPGVDRRSEAATVTVGAGDAITIDAAVTSTPAITGAVTSGGGPVAGAFVWAYGTTDTWVGTAGGEVAADGTYSIGPLPAGQYRVLVLPPADQGLGFRWYDGATTRGGATPVTVADGATATGIDISYGFDSE